MRLLGNDPIPLAVTVEEFDRAVPWIEADDYNDTITAYLRAAQEVVEVASRRPLTPRDVEIEFELAGSDGFRCWWFPVAPVTAIGSVSVIEPFADDAVIELDQVSLQRGHDEPQLWFSNLALAMACVEGKQSVRVQATVGYTSELQPPALKHAIILVVKEWYDAGVSIGDLTEDNLSFGVKALIRQQRYKRPKRFG